YFGKSDRCRTQSGRIYIGRAGQDGLRPSPDLGPRPLAGEPRVGTAAAGDGAEIALLDLVELHEQAEIDRPLRAGQGHEQGAGECNRRSESTERATVRLPRARVREGSRRAP